MGELQRHAQHAGASGQRSHAGHRWLMLACCIPMLLVAISLVLTGVASASALV